MEENMVNEVMENTENTVEAIQTGMTRNYAPVAFGAVLLLAAITGIMYIKKHHKAKDEQPEKTDEDKVNEMFEETAETDDT